MTTAPCSLPVKSAGALRTSRARCSWCASATAKRYIASRECSSYDSPFPIIPSRIFRFTIHGFCPIHDSRFTSRESPLPAHRPANPRLNTSKLTSALGFKPPSWETMLKECISELGSQ